MHAPFDAINKTLHLETRTGQDCCKEGDHGRGARGEPLHACMARAEPTPATNMLKVDAPYMGVVSFPAAHFCCMIHKPSDERSIRLLTSGNAFRRCVGHKPWIVAGLPFCSIHLRHLRHLAVSMTHAICACTNLKLLLHAGHCGCIFPWCQQRDTSTSQQIS